MYVCVPCIGPVFPSARIGGVRSPGTRVIDGYGLLSGY